MIFPVDGIVGQSQDTFPYQNEVAAIVQAVCVGVHPIQRSTKVHLIVFAEVCESSESTAVIEELLYEFVHGHELAAVDHTGVNEDQILICFRQLHRLRPVAQDPKGILCHEFLFPVHLQNMLQQRFTQIHSQRSAGIGIRWNASANHGGIAAHILNEADDL